MKRSPLKRGTSQLKRTPLARVGRKAKTKAARRREVIRFVHQRDQSCQWPIIMGQRTEVAAFLARDLFQCWQSVLDVHEIIPRSVWPDGELDPSNCVLLCRKHHIWVDQNERLAHRVGLHGYSWERP